MKSILVPYIGEDGNCYITSQPKISPARPQQSSNAPEVIPILKSEYTMSEMIQIFEARQTLHEEEFRRRPSRQPAVPRSDPTDDSTEEIILFIIKRFVSLAGAIFGHYQELAMGDLPEASRKADFPTLIRDYCTAGGILCYLIHEQKAQVQAQGQTNSFLALLGFHRWLKDHLHDFLRTAFGRGFAELIPEQPIINPAQSLGPDPAVEYVEQVLDACLINIADATATSREIKELLTLRATLEAALPPSINQSVVHYIGALVKAVCDHVASRMVATQLAMGLHAR